MSLPRSQSQQWHNEMSKKVIHNKDLKLSDNIEEKTSEVKTNKNYNNNFTTKDLEDEDNLPTTLK
jgi:hypothetical protein